MTDGFDKPAWSRKRYQERREAGLCVECGESPPEAGKRRCAPCLAYLRARERERRKPNPDVTAMRSALFRVMAGDSIPDALAYAGIDAGARPRMEPPPLVFTDGRPSGPAATPEPGERACSNCGNPFQPTPVRRMLCEECFKGKKTPVATKRT